MMRLVLSLAALAFSASAFAQSAQLNAVQGEVMLNAGQGFQSVAGETGVEPGHLVMTSEGASAVLVFGDGCRYEVGPSTVVTVPDKSPCAGAVVQSQNFGATGSTTAGSEGVIGSIPPIAYVPIGGSIIAMVEQIRRDNESFEVQPPVSP